MGIRFARTAIAAALLLALTASGAALAQGDIRPLGVNRDWHGFVSGSGESQVCYMVSEPTQTRGNYENRGDVFATISRHPEEGAAAVVAFTMGYPLAPDSVVTVTIDNAQVFSLTPEGERAWSPDPETDAAMVAAMRAGYAMQVEGRSAGGTVTTDTYSLLGFTATHAAAEAACAPPSG